jgi:ribonuclease HI
MTQTLYFDGGARPNPGKMSVAVVLGHEKFVEKLGKGTNNIAEWTAMLWAMQIAQSKGIRDIELIGDSELIVNQATGKYKVKAHELVPFKKAFESLLGGFDAVAVSWVPRAQNPAGWLLEG